ncbi:hypothetical protein QFZ71_003447 [Streptomyces sp. V2I9]|nr:hypothetical protein [Streptomyces sp. V2I9]
MRSTPKWRLRRGSPALRRGRRTLLRQLGVRAAGPLAATGHGFGRNGPGRRRPSCRTPSEIRRVAREISRFAGPGALGRRSFARRGTRSADGRRERHPLHPGIFRPAGSGLARPHLSRARGTRGPSPGGRVVVGVAHGLPDRAAARLPAHPDAGVLGRRPQGRQLPLPPSSERAPGGSGARRVVRGGGCPGSEPGAQDQHPWRGRGPALRDRQEPVHRARLAALGRGTRLVEPADPAVLPGVRAGAGEQLGRDREGGRGARVRQPRPGVGTS